MRKVRVLIFAVVLAVCWRLAFIRISAAQMENNTAINMKGLGTDKDAAPGKGDPFFDKQFLKKAIEASQDDIAMAKLVMEKTTSLDVKEFASDEVEDHGKMLTRLQQEAQEQSLSVSDRPTKGASKSMDKMKDLQGEAFDGAYLQETMKSHRDEDKSYRNEVSTTADPTLKDHLVEDGQILAKHLEQAQELATGKK